MNARLVVMLVLVVLLGALGGQVRLTTDTAAVLPRDNGLARTLDKAQEFAGAQTLLFEVDGAGHTRQELTEAVGALVQQLEALDTIDHVRQGYGIEDGVDIQRRLTPYSTAFIPEAKLKERLSDEGIRTVYEAQLAKLATFTGMFQLNRVKDDPLDLIQLATESLASGAQPGVRPDGGLLIDASGERALLLASSTVPPNQIVPEDPRIQAIQRVVDGSALPVRWFGGHRMAYDTATAIAADVRISAGLGMVLLAGVLFLGFRTWRPVVGALGPSLIAAGCASAAAWWASPVHALQLGFSAALAGLAVDYWVHLYLAAAQRPDQNTVAERYQAAIHALNELLPALAVSAGSTALAFGVLTTSDLPVVSVLGLTGAAAAVGAFLGTVVAGPVAWALLGRPAAIAPTPQPAPWLTTALLLGCVAFGVFGLSATFDADPLGLVARSEDTAAAERVFADRYGLSTRRAIVLVESQDAATTLDRAKRIQDAFDRLGFVTSTGPTGVLPGPLAVTQATQAVPDDLQARMDRIGAEVGMPPLPDAAARIRERLAQPPIDLWTGSVLEPRVALNGNVALISVPLTDDSVADALADTLWAVDAAPLTVPTDVATQGMESARQAILSRAFVGGLAVFLLLAVRHRSLLTAAIALAPAVGAVLVGAGAITLSGSPWNPVSLASMVPVIGLAVDYGVFMTEAEGASAPRAVFLSAATTIAGFLTLGLASSPALFGVGVATVAGVGAAAAIALYAVPSLTSRVWPAPRTGRVLTTAAFVVALIFLLDVGLIVFGAFTPPDVGPLPQHTLTEVGNERRYGEARFARTEGIWLLSTTGDSVEAGYSANQVTQRIRPRLEDEMFTTFEALVPTPLFRWIITRGSNLVGMGMHPYVQLAHQKEIRAGDLADPDPYWFQGPPYTRKIYYHAIHDLGQALVDTPLLACTGFMAGPGTTSNGHWLLGRNFDSEVGVTFDRDKVVRVHRPDQGIPFLSVAFAGLAGAVSGVNQAGIAVTINASASDDLPRLGTPMTLIVREILESARTLDEAEAILRARNGFLSENVLVVDADHGEAALFEITPRRLARLDVQGAMGVSNHFRAPMFADDATTKHRIESSTTAQRLARMEELLAEHQGDLDLETGLDVLSDRRGLGGVELPRGHRHAINADIATHGVVIDATTRTVRVSRYPNLAGGWVELSLEEVLAGNLEATLVRPAEPDAAVAMGMREARQKLLRRARRAGTDEALQLTEQALRLLPDHPEALKARGEVLLRAGRRDEGIAMLQRALAAPPEYAHEVTAIQELLE